VGDVASGEARPPEILPRLLADWEREDWVVYETRQFRSSKGGWWPKVRELLHERGVDPARSALALWFPDNPDQYTAFVVTWDGRVFEFDYDYFDRPLNGGSIINWRDLTGTWPRRDEREHIWKAMALLPAESEAIDR
jgi:hypothetical protein